MTNAIIKEIKDEILKNCEGLSHGIITVEIHIRDGKAVRLVSKKEESIMVVEND